MKRLIFAIVVILGLAALTIWGNRLLGRTLDAELGPLLSKQLGLPVQLSPIQARLMQLSANSANLTMGPADNPAVVASDVQVSLSWSDLLHGEIRLVHVSAADLMVRPSRWPSSNDPLPDNYQFLDQWIPRTLALQHGRYVSESGEAYPVSAVVWERHVSGKATAQWQEDRAAGTVDVDASLQSLSQLLQLAPVEVELTVAVAGKPDSSIALNSSIAPGTSSAYSMQADIQAAQMSAHVTAQGQAAWTLPDHIAITMPELNAKPLQQLLALYSAPSTDQPLSEKLDAAVPQLSLPTLQGNVAIAELRVADEVGKDTVFNFATHNQGLEISKFSSNGPASVIHADLGIVSNTQGWTVKVDAQMQASDATGAMATQLTGSDWLWREGSAQLHGSGDTWGNLLNSLRGDIALKGDYQGKEQTPVALRAQLDNRPGEFALDSLTINLGDGQLNGSAALSGSARRTLKMDLQGARLNLGFLFDTPDDEPLPGLAFPEYLAAMPDLNLQVKIAVDGLESHALSLGQASAELERNEQGGKLVVAAKGTHYGTLDLTLQASTPPNQASEFELTSKFEELDIAEMFQQQGLLYSRSSGTMNFSSRGEGMGEVFNAMKGETRMRVRIRADNNWQRTTTTQEVVSFSGSSHFVTSKDRIVGVEIDRLNVDSLEQNLTGNVSLVSGRTPWFIANLESEKLNIGNLQEMLPESVDDSDDSELLPALKKLGSAQVSLQVKSLLAYDMPLTNVQLDVITSSNKLNVDKFNFVTEQGSLQSEGKISWKGDRADLELEAQVSSVDLDQFLISSVDVSHVPVSGSARLVSEGSSTKELLGNLTGYIDLKASEPTADTSPLARRALSLKATRLEDGVQAQITQFLWGESELSGEVLYHRTTPPTVSINIHSGTLSLLPWEKEYLKTDQKKEEGKGDSTLGSAAKASASFVGDILLTPLRFLADDDETPKGKKLFSTDPLPLDALNDLNMKFSGQLDSMLSTELDAQQLSFEGNVTRGQLAVKASSGQLGGGKGQVTLAVDATSVPPTFEVNSDFQKVKGLTNQDTYPRSGYVSLKSRGQSQAEVAANLDGLLYLELGKGPFDYANSALLTANLASSVFQTLIPGIEREKPTVDCGVTVAIFQQGKGVTPYGFAARTNQANLLGRVHVDLAKETLQMSLDSRGRKGVGISVGSIFSNTIQIKGPLASPSVVPDTTGLAWRGWAAFMTGGLSILGESVIKRVLATENPCTSTKEMIVKDLCPKNTIAAASPMVCPTAQ